MNDIAGKIKNTLITSTPVYSLYGRFKSPVLTEQKLLDQKHRLVSKDEMLGLEVGTGIPV